MNILVDHGAIHNLGDTAMLEGTLTFLRHRLPDAQLYVVDRPRLRTSVFGWSNVCRKPMYRLAIPLRPGQDAARARRWVEHLVSGLGRRILNNGVSRDALPLLYPDWLVQPQSLTPEESFLSLEEYCVNHDALFFAGGGYLNDTFAWSTIQRIALIRAFLQQGKPVLLTGQQIGPFNSRVMRSAVTRVLSRTSFVGTREVVSEEFCQKHSIGRLALMGDDSFGLDVDHEGASELLRKYGLSDGRFLAVNIRIAAYTEEYEQYLADFGAQTRILAERMGMPAIVVPISLNEGSSDIDAGYRLRDVAGDTLLVLDEPDLSPSLVKGVLSHAYGAVGASYHFCTFALSEGVPAICLHEGAYYGQKADGLAAFWGDQRLACRMSSEYVVSHVLDTWRDQGLRLHLSARAEEAKHQWKDIMEQRVVPLLEHRSSRPS